MALPLYLTVSIALLIFWSRRLQPISRAAAIVLVLLPMVFTGRAMLTNRVYAPIDLPFQYEPLKSHATAFGVERPHNIDLSDLHAQMIPWQSAIRFALEQREWPLWNPFILCGDILAAAAQPAVYDPLTWLALLLPLPHALTFGASMTFFFAAFFTFVFARSIGLREGGALVAAAAFTFCAMLTFYVGWPLGRSWTLLPLVLLGVQRVVREQQWGVLAFAFTLLIVAGHPETVLHVVTVGAVYGVVKLVGLRRSDRESDATPSAPPLSAEAAVRTQHSSLRVVGLAVLAGVVALGLTAVYLLPFAEAATQTAEHHFRTELYAAKSYGQIIQPAQRNERIARTFLPWVKGDPLSTRVGFSVLLLALLARRREAWFFAGLALAGFLIACGIPPLPHLLHELPLFDIAINERLAFAGSFALAMLAGMGADRLSSRANAGTATALILAIVLVERTIEDGGIYPAIDAKTFYPEVPELAAIKRDDHLFRVAGVGATLLPNGATLYELEDVRGYEAMTFRRFAQTYPLWSRYQHAFFNIIEDPTRPFLSFLNVRYILRDHEVIENHAVLPRAFIPRRIRFESHENVVHQMSYATDFADLAWIESDQPHDLDNAPGGVKIRRKDLQYLLDASMDGDGWVVVSESHWKGWRAYIDGKRIKTHFANHAFIGLFVPAGEHRVRLVYLPDSFMWGRAISIATLIVLLAVKIIRACRRSPSISSSPSPSS